MKMSEIAYQVQELYIEGLGSRAIADNLGVSVDTVRDFIDSMGVADSDDFDLNQLIAEELSPYSTLNS